MSISDEDKALFRQAVKNIRPHAETEQKPGLLRCARNDGGAGARNDTVHLSSTYHTTLGPESALSYYRSAIPHTQLRRFKKGALSIEAKLDLHGMRAEEAERALIQFITQADAVGRRILLIVHGKGKTHGVPLLKNLVNQWLPQFPQVLAFVSAQPKDGGTGAVYVLLKSQRPYSE